jgi:hypothetical protein
VSDLRCRLADARAAADAAAEELGASKRAREEAEQELRGSQVQAAIAAASVQALQVSLPPHLGTLPKSNKSYHLSCSILCDLL